MASEAGVAVMNVYRSDFEVRRKEDASPVSDADEQAEAIILEALERVLPGVPVVAEEAVSRGVAPAALGSVFVLVDPVDGTREFINRRDEFTVNIALVEDRAPIAGCVYAPALGRIYVGGARAWTGPLGEGAAVSAGALGDMRTRAYPDAGLAAVVSRSHLDERTTAFVERLGIRDRVSAGSSLKFCRVAEGAADVYPRYGPTMEWDTAAGHAVLAAAGGQVLTPEGAPYLYAKPDFRNGPFVAWGGAAL
ncbi:MAG: 3'(2'),5'-bisphosphate nucleotidase CysQ [Caulobacterales bacterium]|nr:3'(2'),5'-bisphosphate nucleotidase CysQ [Caulobacterales bacterium]